MAFTLRQKILFKHCDPAGIVFYPRYFEILNDVVEAFFDEIGSSFHAMHPETGVPTAEISATFVAPSRHGDVLDVTLAVGRIGRTSCRLAFAGMAADEARFRATSTLVHVAGGRPAPWPEPLRAALANHMEGDGI